MLRKYINEDISEEEFNRIIDYDKDGVMLWN